jgi:hypothetical protein
MADSNRSPIQIALVQIQLQLINKGYALLSRKLEVLKPLRQLQAIGERKLR